MPERAGQRGEPHTEATATSVGGDYRHQRGSSTAAEGAAGVDRKLALLATNHHGVLARHQLTALGTSTAAIDHRVRAGRLIVVHCAVYAVGHAALTERGRLRAALLAAGPSAISVTAPPHSGGETRRAPDVRTLDSVPVTAPSTTLVDLAASQPRHQLERLCAEALVLKLVTDQALDEAGIVDPDLVAPTRSKFERTFRAALPKSGLAQPVTGHPIGRSPAPAQATAGHGAARADARSARVNAGDTALRPLRPALTAAFAVDAGSERSSRGRPAFTRSPRPPGSAAG